MNLILTLRKAVSLAISVWYYGAGASSGLVAGGAMVLGGTMIYSMASPPRVVSEKKFDDKEEEEKNKKTHTKKISGEVESSRNGDAAEHSARPESREQTRASSTSVRANGDSGLRQR